MDPSDPALRQICREEPSSYLVAGCVAGVVVEIPPALYTPTGAVRIEVCDEHGCADATQRLDRIPGGRSGRLAEASFHALGRAFAPGKVTVNVQLVGPRGQLVATRHQAVSLVRRYPNGKQCDGDGFVGGHLALEPRDRL